MSTVSKRARSSLQEVEKNGPWGGLLPVNPDLRVHMVPDPFGVLHVAAVNMNPEAAAEILLDIELNLERREVTQAYRQVLYRSKGVCLAKLRLDPGRRKAAHSYLRGCVMRPGVGSAVSRLQDALCDS